MRTSLLLAASLLLCLAGAAQALKAKDVRGVTENGSGGYFIEFEGKQWQVLDDNADGNERPYFYRADTQTSQWDDPRDIAAAKSGKAQRAPSASATPRAKRGGLHSIAMTALVPVLLFIGALAGRIYYLHVYYPELLWPTKERKQRYRNNSKFKPQKARGKMSQDGKGGRSANS